MPTKVVNSGIRLSLLIVTLAIASVTNDTAQAQKIPSLMLFGDVSIGNGFSPDPLTVRGMSGGNVTGKQIAGRSETPTGPCVGFFDEKPDHTLVLTSKFGYLSLVVKSPDDATLIVIGPGGTWCNDDLQGKNPGIVGEWLPGTYKIWVGSYKKERYFPYSLEITKAKW
ncbi:MAG: hypothetical protein PUP91_05820 [Rhizonema sp. PD37]|nr:hypothetical protein [Rhizonema sp. PD37]